MKTIYKFLIFREKIKFLILKILLIIIFTFGLGVYTIYYDLSFLRAFSETVNLFIDAVSTPIGIGENKDSIIWLLDITSIVAKLTLFFTVIMFFFKEQINSNLSDTFIKKGKHILVIGLDRNSRFFINSELDQNNDNIVVVENDKHNPYMQIYRDKGIPILHEEIDTVMDKIGIDSAKYIFVSTGDSQENIATTLKIIKYAKADPNKKLLVHIGDRTLRSLYNDGSLLGTNKLDVQPFSYFKESARKLFQLHDIDGDGLETINSNKEFEIAIVGISNLAIEVIVEAIKISSLPNNNRLIINCIADNIKLFEERVKYEIPYIETIEKMNYIEFKYKKLNHNDISFYIDDFWKTTSLKHLILCHDKTVKNINIFSKLKRVTYKGVLGETTEKIHIATYNDIEISKELKKYHKDNNHVFVFAESNLVCATKNLIHNNMEKIAKMIEYSYKSTLFNKETIVKNQSIIDRVWEGDISIYDKRSNMAQAKHIKVKLKALGLEKQASEKSIEELVIINNLALDKVLNKERQELNLDDNKIYEFSKELKKHHDQENYSLKYFPKEYDRLFEKILRAEHDRWINMLVMMDNRYDINAKYMPKKERKIKKIHHLMKPFDEFEEDEKILILYDIYSLLYIPEYLACVGEEIVEF